MSGGFFFWQSQSLEKLELCAMASKPAPSSHELPLQWNQAPVTLIYQWKNKMGRGRGKWMIQRLNEESPPRMLYQIKHQRRRRLRKRHSKKMNWRCFKLYAYSISFNSSNVANFFWSWILKDCIESQEKKIKVIVLCSFFHVPHKRYFAWAFSRRRSRAATAKKCTKKRDARAESFFC